MLADPLVAAKFGLEFYAGVPLVVRDGTQIGVLCVLDFAARELSDAERTVLEDLAHMAMAEFETQLAAYLAARIADEPDLFEPISQL